MNEEQKQQMLENIKSKSTDELINIWEENDRGQYSDEHFEVIRQLLVERGEHSLPEQRSRLTTAYVHHNKFSVLALLFMFVLGIPISLVLGHVLYAMQYEIEFYLIIVFPVIAGSILALVLAKVVHVSKMTHAPLAGYIGMILGSFMYILQHSLGFFYGTPIKAESFIEYITYVAKRGGTVGFFGTPFFSYSTFGFLIIAAIEVSIILSWTRSKLHSIMGRNILCPQCGKWYGANKIFFNEISINKIEKAIISSSLDDLSKSVIWDADTRTGQYTGVLVESCASESCKGSNEIPVYVSIIQ